MKTFLTGVSTVVVKLHDLHIYDEHKGLISFYVVNNFKTELKNKFNILNNLMMLYLYRACCPFTLFC